MGAPILTHAQMISPRPQKTVSASAQPKIQCFMDLNEGPFGGLWWTSFRWGSCPTASPVSRCSLLKFAPLCKLQNECPVSTTTCFYVTGDPKDPATALAGEAGSSICSAKDEDTSDRESGVGDGRRTNGRPLRRRLFRFPGSILFSSARG